MNDFIISSLEKLKKKNIPNAEIDLRVLLNYSKYSKNEIILSNFDLDQINIDLFNKVLNTKRPCLTSSTLCTLKILTPCEKEKIIDDKVPPILSFVSYFPEI